MDISRSTVQEIYKSARRKIAVCLVHGKKLVITDGNYPYLRWAGDSTMRSVLQHYVLRFKIAAIACVRNIWFCAHKGTPSPLFFRVALLRML